MFIIKPDKFTTKNLLLLLCLVVFLVYVNSLFNEFVWDDLKQIIDNPIIHDLSNLPSLFLGGTYAIGRGALYYKPLLSLSFMINFFLWRERPFGFHLFQIILHLSNVVLVFLIFKELLIREKIKKSEWVAFWVALIFGIHPANVEAVAYISATQEVLFSIFILSAFWMVLKGYSQALWASAILFFLSLLSKETAIAGGGVILLYLLLFKREKLWQWLTAFGLVFGFYLWLRLGVARLSFTNRGVALISQASLAERILTMPWEFYSYLRIIFWPRILSVGQHFIVREITIKDFWFPLGMSLSFLGSLGYWGVRKKSKLFCFFSLWFLGSIFFHLNLLPLSMTVAERWLYFPLIGFLGASSLIVLELVKRKKRKKIFISALVIILIALSARTIKRNFDWQNELKLLSNDIIYSQNAYDVENNLGVDLLFEGKIDEAIIHFERSIELNPIEYSSYNSLGYALYLKGNLDEAKEALLKSLSLEDNYGAYMILALVNIKQENYDYARDILEKNFLKFPKTSKIEEIFRILEESEKRSRGELD